MSQNKGMSLSGKILIAMAIGITVGLILNSVASDVEWVQKFIVMGLFEAVGKIFVASLQMLVVPLVFVSLVCGVSSLQDSTKLDESGLKL